VVLYLSLPDKSHIGKKMPFCNFQWSEHPIFPRNQGNLLFFRNWFSLW
jgi:hypothetical protein